MPGAGVSQRHRLGGGDHFRGIFHAEGLGDDVLNRWVFDGEILDRKLAEQSLGDGGGTSLGDAELDLATLANQYLTQRCEVITGNFAVEVDLDDLEGCELLREVIELTVKEDVAVIDDDDPLAQGGDIGHVMAGQYDRGAVLAVVLGDELSYAGLHGDVDADGGLV